MKPGLVDYSKWKPPQQWTADYFKGLDVKAKTILSKLSFRELISLCDLSGVITQGTKEQLVDRLVVSLKR